MAFHGSSGSSVGRAYIEFVAEQDRDIHPSPRLSAVWAASYMLGGYCCQITKCDRNTARTTHNAATRIFRQHSRNPIARLALITAKLIDYRNRTPLSEAQAALLKETRQQMYAKRVPIHYNDGGAKLAYARLAEHATLVALSNARDDRFLAQRALPHHDERRNGRPSANFDLTATVAGAGTPFTQKLQIKLPCIGKCSDPEPEAEIYEFETRSEYDDDIKLISGCCDLGMRLLPDGGYDLTLVHDLMSGDPVSPPLITRATYGLLQIIANGEDRRGFIPTSAGTPLAA